MDPRIAPFTVLTEAVASCQPPLFELSVEAACATGASQQDLITAVEVARLLGEVPPRVLARAYASIDAVREIEARRLARSADGSPFAPSQGKGIPVGSHVFQELLLDELAGHREGRGDALVLMRDAVAHGQPLGLARPEEQLPHLLSGGRDDCMARTP